MTVAVQGDDLCRDDRLLRQFAKRRRRRLAAERLCSPSELTGSDNNVNAMPAETPVMGRRRLDSFTENELVSEPRRRTARRLGWRDEVRDGKISVANAFRRGCFN